MELISIQFNGEEKLIKSDTIKGILTEFELSEHGLAVELNHKIIPKSEYSVKKIAPGDRLEVVKFVGGG